LLRWAVPVSRYCFRSKFYKISDKELLFIRNKIIQEVGIPALLKNDFSKSPFSTSWFGEYDRNIMGYSYEFCRLSERKYLEVLNITIVAGDQRIAICLNIFEIFPNIVSIAQLSGSEGINFKLSSNNLNNMYLRDDDYKEPPIFYMLFLPEHKIGNYYSKIGFEKEVIKLRELIKKDMTIINSFVKRWHELHKPIKTDWEGNSI
jgi:hypothetical protein